MRQTLVALARGPGPGAPAPGDSGLSDRAETHLRPTVASLGSWEHDPTGRKRFRPVDLKSHRAVLSGMTPDMSGLLPYPDRVKHAALHVLTRYLCGGVALQDSGGVSWPDLLGAEAGLALRQVKADRTRHETLADALVRQQRQFTQAVSRLGRRPLRLDDLLAAHALLAPELCKAARGNLRRCDVWWRGKSIDDAEFVAVRADEIPDAVAELLAAINRVRTCSAAESNLASLLTAKRGAPSLGCDFALAVYVALLAWHPFTDGNGRVARTMCLALAGDSDHGLVGRLFNAGHLLVTRALQPRTWSEMTSRCQRGLEPVESFRTACRESAEFALCLCHRLLDGLHAAVLPGQAQASGCRAHPCPLIFVHSGGADGGNEQELLLLHSGAGKKALVGRATLGFLIAFESALRACVEEPSIAE